MGRRTIRKPLTILQVSKLQKPGFYADGACQGLFLKVRGPTAKSWIFQCAVPGQKTKAGNPKRVEIGLGSATGERVSTKPKVSLTEARASADQHRRRIGKGEFNPVEQTSTILTFQQATEQVWQQQSRLFKNKKDVDGWINTLMPLLDDVGQKPVNRVTGSNLLNFFKPIWHQEDSSQKKLQRIRKVFEWAIFKNYIASDPSRGIELDLPRHRNIPRHHPQLPYKRLPAFVRDLRRTERTGPIVKLAFEFLIICHSRTAEVLRAKWDQIDLDERVWIVPMESMKTAQAHAVPLEARAMEILKEAKALAPFSDVVFAGTSRKYDGGLSDGTFMKARTAMGYKQDFVVHGLRGSFGKWAQEVSDYGREPADKALAHREKSKTQAAYFQSDSFDQRRKQQAEWEAFLNSKVKKA